MQGKKTTEIGVAIKLVFVLLFVAAFSLLLTTATDPVNIQPPQTSMTSTTNPLMQTDSRLTGTATALNSLPVGSVTEANDNLIGGKQALDEAASMTMVVSETATHKIGNEFQDLLTEASPMVTVTHTPTRLPSPTSTVVPPLVASATPTVAISPSPINSPTVTKPPPLSGAPISRLTNTPTATATMAPSPTVANIKTAQPTGTLPNTRSPTVIPSDTKTATLTPSATATPSFTASATPTLTSTPSPDDLGIILPTETQVNHTEFPLPECAVPDGWLPYIARPADTLQSLAFDVGATVEDLGEANCLENPDQIYAGSRLFIPVLPKSVDLSDNLNNFVPSKVGCKSPFVTILHPTPGESLSSVFEVKGTAMIPGQDYYKLEIRPQEYAEYQFWSKSSEFVSNSILGIIDSSVFSNGLYWIRVTAINITGNIPEDSTCEIPVIFG